MPDAYVVMNNDRPIAATTDLDTAKTAATLADGKYLSKPRDYRWDEYADLWQLMFRSATTGRWNKAYVSVHRVEALPAPAPPAGAI
ncbi:hypothetical protein [Kitasatospora indigofera]|uniref:hypothetical protein n=1 Tax=Kitasatospora indigofera TaxID=67307 RepID=UPI0036C0326E